MRFSAAMDGARFMIYAANVGRGCRSGSAMRRAVVVAPSALCGAALAASLAMGTAAQAQSLTPFDRDVSSDVLTRPHPEYDPLGIHVSNFLVYPSLYLGGTYDDNIYGLPNGTSDVVGVIKPEVSAVSQWSRHQLTADLTAEFDEYADHSAESADQFNATLRGRIDVDRNTQITILGSEALITEPRTSPDSLAAFQEPVQYTEGQIDVGAYHTFDRIRLSGSVNFANYQYQNVKLANGETYDERSRDESSIYEVLRADYAIGPKITAFVSVSPNQSFFDEQPPQVQLNYNSEGVSLLGGVDFQVTHLITGEIGMGYYTQHYDDAHFGEASGFDYNAQMKYFPTQLTTVTLKVQHSIAPSGIPQSPSTFENVGSLGVDYELLRNCVISAHGEYDQYTYPGLSRRDDRYGAGAQVRYLLNRAITLTLSFNHLTQTSDGLGRGYDFDDNQVSVGVTLHR